MAERRFKKAPRYVGKYLSLFDGASDRTIHDGVTLYGGKWSKFVQLGFLQEITEEEDKPEPRLTPSKVDPKVKTTTAPAEGSQASVPAPTPTPTQTPTQAPPAESVTRSPIDKVDSAVGAVSTDFRKGRGRGKK